MSGIYRAARSRIAAALIAFTVLATMASLLLAPAALGDSVWNVDCSVPDLVSAVQQADTAGSGTINLAAGCTYTFTTAYGPGDALPIVGLSGPLTINGNGATLQRSSAAGTPDFRLLQIGGYPFTGTLDVTIDDLTITGGYVPDGSIGGGGIQQGTPGLKLQDDTISDNSVPTCGGGIESSHGGLTISDSAITGNTQRNAKFGYISLCGWPVAGGGGGLLLGGHTTITGSTIADNTANFGGGGIYGGGAGGGHGLGPNESDIILLEDDTIVDNVAPAPSQFTDGGGGIWTVDDMRLVNDTIAGNSPTQLAQYGADANTTSNYFMQGSILVGHCDLEPGLPVLGQGANVDVGGCPLGNLSEATRVHWCPPAGCPPDVTTAMSADLGPLASNGGPTQTEDITALSPAIGLEPAANCPATDQRGAVRPQPGAVDCDAGAYELQTIATAVSYSGPASGSVGAPLTVSATLTHPDAAAGLPTPAGGGVPDQPLTITVGAESCTATTGASGVASCQLTPLDSPAGSPYPITVRFAGGPDGAGTDQLAASADTGRTFTVTAAPVPSPPAGSSPPAAGSPTPAAGSPPPAAGSTGSSTGTVSPASSIGPAGSPPRVTITSGRAVVRHHRAAIALSCRGARGGVCRGTLRLSIRVHRRSHGARSRTRARTVLLARGDFRLVAGSRRFVTLTLGRYGRGLMARARRHRIAVTATAALTATAVPAAHRSSPAHRRVVLVLARTARRRHGR